MPVQQLFERGDEVKLTDATFVHSSADVPNRGDLVERNSKSIDLYVAIPVSFRLELKEHGAPKDSCHFAVVAEAFVQDSSALGSGPYCSHTWGYGIPPWKEKMGQGIEMERKPCWKLHSQHWSCHNRADVEVDDRALERTP